jgi:hypothetical protein
MALDTERARVQLCTADGLVRVRRTADTPIAAALRKASTLPPAEPRPATTAAADSAAAATVSASSALRLRWRSRLSALATRDQVLCSSHTRSAAVAAIPRDCTGRPGWVAWGVAAGVRDASGDVQQIAVVDAEGVPASSISSVPANTKESWS